MRQETLDAISDSHAGRVKRYASVEELIADLEMGAWPDNPAFPVSWGERDAKGV